MEFRLLGPLEVRSEGTPVPVGGAKERALLEALLLRSNEFVSVELLIDELWGERPPRSARHTLEAYVSRLRSALPGEGLIESGPGGYRIRVGEEGLDLIRFERLLGEGHAALGSGAPAAAEAKLAAALALWRGRPLADLGSATAGDAARLEEMRLAAVEAHAAACLALGRHAELAGELRALAAAYPLREALRARLMLALYRSGLQAEALEAYREGRRLLVEELGIEPGRELQQLQQSILRHDPALEPPAAAEERSAAPAAAPAAAPVAAQEQRKVVTALFCDLAESTVVAERLDPEALRAVLADYVERVKAVVERHGGTVEKFIGDAVMAVFGVPRLHEDDALRACRAALEIRAALPELGPPGRIGVATGEVVTGTEERLATGAPIHLAARLEQAAEPGEILLDADTARLLGARAATEELPPLAVRGMTEPVAAFRLLRVGAAPQPVHESRFVGREQELALLTEAWERVQSERRCELVTIVGEAGVGKSRLVAEALARIEARQVHGRCLPYGEGITYWPVVEVLKQLRALPADPAAAAPIRSLLRQTDEAASAEEIAWAFRKLLEQEAPLVVAFDDVQWGEATFLDLLEGVALLAAGAPLLVLCVARPELLDRRPQWPAMLRLEPLPTERVHELIGDRVARELRERIARAAGGNPLFVLEMLAIAEHGGDQVAVPPTLRALLAARLDQLDEPERRVLERAAVEGEVFHRGAVHALLPNEPRLTPRLTTLVRRELIRPDKAQLPGEDAFRFRHLLIRDAAYDALPKTTRADLHERFANWLESSDHRLVELDELLGYHLEQAAGYRQELGPRDERAPGLAMRARERLASAGRRALDRGDASAAKLLGRALALTETDRDQLALRLDLAGALVRAGDASGAREAAVTAASLAAAAGDRRGELLARLKEISVTAFGGDFEARHESLALACEALSYFERLGDDEGLANAWFAVGNCEWYLSHYGRGLDACRQARKHARRAGLTRIDRQATVLMGWMLFAGPTPVSEALRWYEDNRQVEGSMPLQGGARAASLARIGRFDDARAAIREAVERSEQLGDTSVAGIEALYWPEVERLAGDLAAAERHLRRGCEMMELAGAEAYLSTFLCVLAEVLCELGRDGEAEELTRGGELAASDDLDTRRLMQQVRARVLARRGEWQQAEKLAREAVALAEQTDAPVYRGDALAALAEVLATADRTEEAKATLERALAEYEQKGVLPLLEHTRERLGELRPAAPAPVEE